MSNLDVIRRLEAMTAGRPLHVCTVLHLPKRSAAESFVCVFVRAGGEARPWGVAWGRPDRKPSFAIAGEPRDLELVAGAMAEFSDALLEHAKVFDNYYGTPRKPVDDALDKGRDVLFDIDWQGTQQLMGKAEKDLVGVFILPPTMQALRRRLEQRAQDTSDVVAKRMARASDEMSHYAEYDYVLINVDVDKSLADVRAILQAERLRRQRQIGLTEFVADLRGRV